MARKRNALGLHLPVAVVLVLVTACCLFPVSGRPLSAQESAIDLADIVAGGDGTGDGGGDSGSREFTAVDIDTGLFLTEEEVSTFWFSTTDGDLVNPSPVEGSEFIDSVFFIDQETTEINSGGVTFTWAAGDVLGSSFNHILSNFTHLLEDGDRGISVGGRRDWESCVAVHSAAGITFNLDAMRETYGADAVHTLATFAGMNECSCVPSFTNLYIIFSDADGIVEHPGGGGLAYWTAIGSPNRGERHVTEIPAGASFLTLATGAAEGDFCCDQAVYANARIIPESEIPCERLEVAPETLALTLEGGARVQVTCVDTLGLPQSVATAESGTTYSVEPVGVVTVDEGGFVQAVGEGDAEVTVTNGELSDTVSVSVAERGGLDLGDIVAGGDGTGSGGGDVGGREFTAIHIDTGALLTETDVAAAWGDISDGDLVNPSPVDDSEFVDVVFFMDMPILPINSEGVEFEWMLDDPFQGSWNHILSNFTHMLEDGLRDITAGGISDFSTAVSVHAAAGITFDLRALRDRFGPDAVHTFSAFIGASPCDCGPAIIRQYVIFSNEDEILEDENAEEEPYWSRLFETSQGEQYEGEIPPDAAYLTLATGSAGFDICCDHGVFADAQILPCPAADCPSAGQSAFRRGDVDGNGALEVTDPIANLSFQFLGTFEPTCLDALDWDDSGTIEITDPISSLTRQFLGGTPAAAPGSEACGADPSADELDCVASPTCE